jgi:polyvinyl alcohol dehydrogenase (cytochrome)
MRRLARVIAIAATLAACDNAPDPGPAPSPQTFSPAPSHSALMVSSGDWPTYHHDNGRTGVAVDFPAPTGLSVSWRTTLDGAVYGQPLSIGGVVFAATEHDTVYALDGNTGAQRWSVNLGTPVPRKNLPCGNINPLGITSTMAYDPATGLLFALAETTGGRHTLYGIDAATGAVRVVRAAEPPKGDQIAHQQRSALTVLDGRVYIAYGGLAGDCAKYIGSVVAVPTSGAGPILSYVVPTPREGGIWAPGGASVANGRLLYAVGNGESTRKYDGSDSVLALTPDLGLADRFSPTTWVDDNRRDLDLGSMTPAVVGGYVFIAGKRGVGFSLRADKLSSAGGSGDAGGVGGIGGEVAQKRVCAGYGGAAVDGDIVYVPCNDGTAAVRIGSAGQIDVLWHTDAPVKGSPVIGGGSVWVVDYDGGTLYLLDPATGAVRHKLSIGTMPHFASPTLAGGRAYIGTMTGVVAVVGH